MLGDCQGRQNQPRELLRMEPCCGDILHESAAWSLCLNWAMSCTDLAIERMLHEVFFKFRSSLQEPKLLQSFPIRIWPLKIRIKVIHKSPDPIEDLVWTAPLKRMLFVPVQVSLYLLVQQNGSSRPRHIQVQPDSHPRPFCPHTLAPPQSVTHLGEETAIAALQKQETVEGDGAQRQGQLG